MAAARIEQEVCKVSKLARTSVLRINEDKYREMVPDMQFGVRLGSVVQRAVRDNDRTPALWNDIFKELYYWLPKHDSRSASLAILAMGKLGMLNTQLLDHIAKKWSKPSVLKNYCLVDLVAICQGFALLKYPIPSSHTQFFNQLMAEASWKVQGGNARDISCLLHALAKINAFDETLYVTAGSHFLKDRGGIEPQCIARLIQAYARVRIPLVGEAVKIVGSLTDILHEQQTLTSLNSIEIANVCHSLSVLKCRPQSLFYKLSMHFATLIDNNSVEFGHIVTVLNAYTKLGILSPSFYEKLLAHAERISTKRKPKGMDVLLLSEAMVLIEKHRSYTTDTSDVQLPDFPPPPEKLLKRLHEIVEKGGGLSAEQKAEVSRNLSRFTD